MFRRKPKIFQKILERFCKKVKMFRKVSKMFYDILKVLCRLLKMFPPSYPVS